MQGLEQCLVLVRLLHIFKCAVLHRLNGNADITLPCQHNHRPSDASPDQFLLDLQTGQHGHVYVEDYASRSEVIQGIQERHPRFVGDYLIAGALKQDRRGLANALVIIDNMNQSGSMRRTR